MDVTASMTVWHHEKKKDAYEEHGVSATGESTESEM